ncbi:MAG: 2-C-methyl-D-erythritol 2,4-cyclodiphosphate synthase [Bacteroidota bacterium]|nr:2-C-methyl-D-erythritol 2,4-cyclodiphosphate synthase [Bacteroidota bacterium]
MKYRIGFGYDVHRLEDGEHLFLGGISIPSGKRAVGHSDADVLIHALCDALLGAANLGDIGQHFPDTDAAYKGIDSKILLQQVMDLVRGKGFLLGNADMTVCLEKPKVMPHASAMQEALAKVMKCDADCLSIKATTNEKLGYIGREDGICAYAVVLLEKVVT